MPLVESTEVVLLHSNVGNNDYQQHSKVYHAFVFDKSFVQLLDILPKNFIFLKSFNSNFLYTELWFTEQNSKPLERSFGYSIDSLFN